MGIGIRHLAFAGATALAATFVAMAPAAAEDCKPKEIDIGGRTVEGGCGKLKIAVAIAASNNVYLQANIQAAKDAAAKNGADIEIFDANWNPANSFN
ncbi:hypothetical protein AB4144_50630, partial [Rhizobiaceae sp. 2RAB30]